MIKRRRRLGVAVWRDVLARFAASGLTAQVFSEREKVGLQSLYRWRSKLGQSVDQPSVRTTVPAAIAAKSGDGFLDLGSLNPHSRLELRLDFGGGVILQIARS
jgi:hypothetical protein